MGIRIRLFPEIRRAGIPDGRFPDTVLLLPVCRGDNPDTLHRTGWLLNVSDADEPESESLGSHGIRTLCHRMVDRMPFQHQL